MASRQGNHLPQNVRRRQLGRHSAPTTGVVCPAYGAAAALSWHECCHEPSADPQKPLRAPGLVNRRVAVPTSVALDNLTRGAPKGAQTAFARKGIGLSLGVFLDVVGEVPIE